MSGAPIRVPRFFSRRRTGGGWSFVELVMIIAIAGGLIGLTVMRFRPLDVQSYQQADGLRNDLRHMQMMAITWSQPLRLTAAAGNYSVACVTAGAVPCNVSPVIDPATAKSFSVTLQTGLTLAGPGFNLDFDALGRPKNGAALTTANSTFTISGGASTPSVVVSPTTGFAVVQ
jgi:hypothetical protein